MESPHRPLSTGARTLLAVAVLLTLALALAAGLALRQRRIERQRAALLAEQVARARADLEDLASSFRSAPTYRPLVEAAEAGHPGLPLFMVADGWRDAPLRLVTAAELEDQRAQLRFLLVDPWGRPYVFRAPGPVHHQGWDLSSLGPDGIDERGGGDDILVGEDVSPEAVTRLRLLLWSRNNGLSILGLEMDNPGRPLTPEAIASILTTWDHGVPVPLRDAWGHLVRFQAPGPVHRHGWDFWSAGANGIDEDGAGDDIVVGWDVGAVTSR